MAFGALMAMAISALLIRLVLPDQIYPLYGVLFLLQAIYLAYFSGQGFTWPLLSYARPFANYAYNVPVALSAAVAALFVREFANLQAVLAAGLQRLRLAGGRLRRASR